MSDQHSRRRAWGEKHIQPQAGGTFLVRPFGLFGGVYELPHAAARDRYVENGLRSESWCVSFIVGAFFLPFVVVYWLRLPSQWWGLAAILPVFAVFAAVAAMHWRLLRHIAATRVPRSRWFGSAVRDPSGFSTLGWLRVRLVLCVVLTLGAVSRANGIDAFHPSWALVALMCGAGSAALWIELRSRGRP